MIDHDSSCFCTFLIMDDTTYATAYEHMGKNGSLGGMVDIELVMW